jgi:hypothetical protein
LVTALQESAAARPHAAAAAAGGHLPPWGGSTGAALQSRPFSDADALFDAQGRHQLGGPSAPAVSELDDDIEDDDD